MSMIVISALLGKFSQSKLNLVSQNMFGPPMLQRWTACWWVVVVVWKNATCMHVHPSSESIYSYRIPQSVVKMHLKMLTRALATTTPGERQWLHKVSMINTLFLTHTSGQADTYPMSDTICSTMCLLKAMITNSFCGKTREILISFKTYHFLIICRGIQHRHKD